jgi:hypothetical protein
MKKLLLVLLIVGGFSFNVSSQSKEEREGIKKILNEFCNEYYQSCFDGRRYVSGSLTVSRMEAIDSKTTRIYGRHTYLNYINLSSTTDYYADIYINPRTDYMKITFNKESVGLSTYWESCSHDSEE